MLNFEPILKWMCVSLRAAEEEISFPPTYRYERGSRDTYVWQKQKATGVRSLSYVRATSDKFFLFLCLVLIILLFRLSQMRTNVPSWCDRILWKSYPETHIVCNSYGEDHQKKKTFIISPHNAKWTEIKVVVYFCFFVFLPGCTDDVVTSDHSPVFATFEVGVTSQFVSKKGTNLILFPFCHFLYFLVSLYLAFLPPTIFLEFIIVIVHVI